MNDMSAVQTALGAQMLHCWAQKLTMSMKASDAMPRMRAVVEKALSEFSWQIVPKDETPSYCEASLADDRRLHTYITRACMRAGVGERWHDHLRTGPDGRGDIGR